jgi:uncharacterized protein (TIGR02118 family)
MICVFLTYRATTASGQFPAPHWLADKAAQAQDWPGLQRFVSHMPGTTQDPYLQDQDLPLLVLQLYFAELADAEAQLALGGGVEQLLDHRLAITQQAMLVRRYTLPEGRAGVQQSTYLVAYYGAPLDYSAWLQHYVRHHIPLMQRLAGLRELEIYTRVDWASALPVPRSQAVQRNKVVFDDTEAMSTALNSPLRHEMRADYHAFPPFEGANQHYPMISRQW